MSAATQEFTGIWLDAGARRGTDFSHAEDQYDHREAESEGSTPMRHAFVEQEGGRVGVWVPASWSDEQARQALESNW